MRPPEINGSAAFKEWVKDVEVVDPLTSKINFNKPAPRFVRDFLALGHENHYPILPKHIWEGQDFTTFTSSTTWQRAGRCGTGAYKLVCPRPTSRRSSIAATTGGVRRSASRTCRRPSASRWCRCRRTTRWRQLHIANQIDGGRQLLSARSRPRKAQNDKLSSWNAEGPNWGAPDGCDYSWCSTT